MVGSPAVTTIKFCDTPQIAFSGNAYDRFEFIRSGSTLTVYKNGIVYTSANIGSTVPYYAGFGTQLVGVGLPMNTWSSFDDLVIGTNEEHNVISCPPQSWFVAKDIFDPGFSGLYSAVDTQEYTDAMHCSYANDDGSSTIKVAHVGTGTVYDTQTVSNYAGIVTINLTTTLFNSGAPYGQYRVYIDGTSAEDYFWYKAIATSGTSVQWDDTEYTNGDTATVTFSISEGNWDADTYTYRVEIWDENLDETSSQYLPARPIATNKTYSVAEGTTFPATGTYYCVLTATDISSGEEILLVYDDCYVTLPGSGEVIIEGETYDATTNATLASCTVTATQLGSDHVTTSDAATGAYEINNLVTDWSLGVNASKTGYVGYLVAFTPYSAGTYGVDVPLVPSGGPDPGDYSNATTSYYNSTTDGTALGGLCYEGPYWSLCDGCEVTVSNATWNCTTTTGAGGWYQCNNVPCGGTYSLSCSKSGYSTYSTSCSLTEGCFNREDCTIECSNDLTVLVRDLESGGLVANRTVTVELDTGQMATTTTGSCIFSGLPYGYYTITASAEDYYPGTAAAVMDEAKTVPVYIQEEWSTIDGSSGPVSYAPFNVRFSFRDQNSNPLDNLSVTATPLESTGPWAWLSEWLGIAVVTWVLLLQVYTENTFAWVAATFP